MPFPLFSGKKILGIDIGSCALRIVEIGKSGQNFRLENYGQLESKFLYGKPFRSFEKGVLSLSSKEIAKALILILKEAKFSSKIANFALPDFSSFFTTFSLPPIPKNELEQAVKFEARRHVPLPLDEMAIDWTLAESSLLQGTLNKIKILLVAIPKRIIEEYKEIAKLAGLSLQNLETEVFALKRALFPQNYQKIAALIDIGAKSTTCSIIEGQNLKLTHSFDLSGKDFTKALTKELEVDLQVAEKLKLKYGLDPQGKVIFKVLKSVVDLLIIEIEKIFDHYFRTENKKIQEIVLAGGGANLKGIKSYFEEKLKIQVKIANPFLNLNYPQILEDILTKEAPSWTVAIGVALGGL